MIPCLSEGTPIPVSQTENFKVISRSVTCSSATSTDLSPPFRELDSVTDQIDDDLSEPPRVAVQKVRQFRRNTANQFDSLLAGAGA